MAIEIKVRKIKIYDDSEIRLEVASPSELERLASEGLKDLGWKMTMDSERDTTTFTKRKYPIQEFVSVRCEGNCSGLATSYLDPHETKVDGRIVVPATVIRSALAPILCKVSERNIDCTVGLDEPSADTRTWCDNTTNFFVKC